MLLKSNKNFIKKKHYIKKYYLNININVKIQ